MRIENTSIQLNSTKNQKSPQFTGAFVETLRFLNTNQAWGANAVDFGFMVLPRTITDFGRNASAGWETGRRECMGTLNDSSVGAYGMLAGLLFATGLNSAYGLTNGLRANSVFADSETIDMLGNIWHSKVRSEAQNPLNEFLKDVLKNYEALSPDTNGSWVRLNDTAADKVANILEKEILNSKKEISKSARLNAKNMIMSALGAENNIRIIAQPNHKPHTSRYNIDYILENTHKLAQLFSKENIAKEFKNAEKYADVRFAQKLKRMNLKRSLLGVAIATVIGTSTQPINMYLTKKKTGSDSFVGGGEKDSSLKFNIQKWITSLLFGCMVISTIGRPKDLIKHLQFKGFTPSINQLKFIYGATIFSRFLAARNENELKEAATKDILGFVNWLILGNFVQKLVAQGMDKTLIKRDGNGILNWIRNSSLKTRDEVLHAALKEKAFTKRGKALTFSKMMEAASNNKAAQKQLRILTISQLIGYAYSGLVLGYGIPKLNIFLTNRREAAKKNKQKLQEHNIQQDTNIAANKPSLEQFTGKVNLNDFKNVA